MPLQSPPLLRFADTFSWHLMAESGAVPLPRYAHASVSVGSRVVVIGGYNETYGWLNDVCVLDTGKPSGPFEAQFR